MRVMSVTYCRYICVAAEVVLGGGRGRRGRRGRSEIMTGSAAVTHSACSNILSKALSTAESISSSYWINAKSIAIPLNLYRSLVAILLNFINHDVPWQG
jgi:hypothetical protein